MLGPAPDEGLAGRWWTRTPVCCPGCGSLTSIAACQPWPPCSQPRGLGDHSNHVARGLATAASAAEALIWPRLQVNVPTLPGNPPHWSPRLQLLCASPFALISSGGPPGTNAKGCHLGPQRFSTVSNSPQRSPEVTNDPTTARSTSSPTSGPAPRVASFALAWPTLLWTFAGGGAAQPQDNEAGAGSVCGE